MMAAELEPGRRMAAAPGATGAEGAGVAPRPALPGRCDVLELGRGVAALLSLTASFASEDSAGAAAAGREGRESSSLVASSGCSGRTFDGFDCEETELRCDDIDEEERAASF